MFLKVVRQGFSDSRVYCSCNFAVAELGFRLSFELRFGHFHRNDSREPFAEVFGRYFHLGFLDLFGGCLLGVFLEHAGERLSETLKVRSAFDGVYVVYV